jgi:hypothetical protein
LERDLLFTGKCPANSHKAGLKASQAFDPALSGKKITWNIEKFTTLLHNTIVLSLVYYPHIKSKS